MSRDIRRGLVGSAACWLVFAGAAWGQVDHRVNQGTAAGAGHALDANPAVGGGGLNLSNPGVVPGAYSNALITGNVTGYGAFQGYSPVEDVNRFRGYLPSSGLAAFEARSVHLGALEGNLPPTAGFYYDPQRTIADLGSIRNNLNAPGSSRLLDPRISPRNATTPMGSSPFVFAPRDRADLRLRIDEAPQLYGMRQVPSAGATGGSASAVTSVGSASPGPLSGLPVSGGSGSMSFRPSWGAGGEGAWAPGMMSGIGATGPGGVFGAGNALGGTMEGGAGTGVGGVGESGVSPGGPGSSGAGGYPGAGADRYSDLMTAVAVAQRSGVVQLGFVIEAEKQADGGGSNPGAGGGIQPGGGEAGEAGPEIRPSREEVRRRSHEDMDRLAAASVWARNTFEKPIQTFVGFNQDQVNDYMARAEEALHKGEYLKAARLFDLAHLVDETNPLPLLGRAHALAAGGNYATAVLMLKRGIQRFPQIAAFRLDLPALVGQHDIFDIRRAELENELDVHDDPELRFLLGYLELYSGLPELGLRNLEQAARKSPPESVISMFPDLVLGHRELPPIGGKAGG